MNHSKLQDVALTFIAWSAAVMVATIAAMGLIGLFLVIGKVLS